MNEVKLIKVANPLLSTKALQTRINEELINYSEDDYKLINIQIIDDRRAVIMLQSKY